LTPELQIVGALVRLLTMRGCRCGQSVTPAFNPTATFLDSNWKNLPVESRLNASARARSRSSLFASITAQRLAAQAVSKRERRNRLIAHAHPRSGSNRRKEETIAAAA
jgi:hypothetical protein